MDSFDDGDKLMVVNEHNEINKETLMKELKEVCERPESDNGRSFSQDSETSVFKEPKEGYTWCGTRWLPLWKTYGKPKRIKLKRMSPITTKKNKMKRISRMRKRSITRKQGRSIRKIYERRNRRLHLKQCKIGYRKSQNEKQDVPKCHGDDGETIASHSEDSDSSDSSELYPPSPVSSIESFPSSPPKPFRHYPLSRLATTALIRESDTPIIQCDAESIEDFSSEPSSPDEIVHEKDKSGTYRDMLQEQDDYLRKQSQNIKSLCTLLQTTNSNTH